MTDWRQVGSFAEERARLHRDFAKTRAELHASIDAECNSVVRDVHSKTAIPAVVRDHFLAEHSRSTARAHELADRFLAARIAESEALLEKIFSEAPVH